MSIHTDMSVGIIKQHLHEDMRWTVKESAEYTGISMSTVLQISNDLNVHKTDV